MKKMTLNNMYEWPLMTRLLLLGFVFAVVFYAGYRFDLSAQGSVLARSQQQESDLKGQIELVISKNKMLKSEVAKLPEQLVELAKWKKQLIEYKDLPALLNEILKIGGDNHLFFSLFTPGESVKVAVPSISLAGTAPVAPGGVAAPATAAATPGAPGAAPVDDSKTIYFGKVPIKVVVVGNYHQIADFVSQLANMASIVSIRDFTISNEDATTLLGEKLAKQAEAQHLLSAELTLEVYHLPESKLNEPKS